MSGTADSRRTKAKAASALAVLTSSSETPTLRSATSSTRNSDRWLTTVVSVIHTQRPVRRPMICSRKATARSSHRRGGRAARGRIAKPATAEASEPMRRASASLRSSRAKMHDGGHEHEEADDGGAGRPAPGLPVRASRASARIGRPSFTKLFQTPDTTLASTMAGTGMPHDRSMLSVTPMPSAAPPGTVLATAVEPRFERAASRISSPGRTATSSGQ